jgi:hypothetical protein
MPRDRLSKTTLAAAVCVGTALWLSFGILSVTDADRARRIGLLPPLWLLAVLVVGAIAAATVTRLSQRTSLPLFLSLLIALPWIPVRVPDLFLALTGPAVLFVWGAIAFGLLVILASRQPAARFAVIADPCKAPLLAAALAFGVFLAVWTGQFRPPTGDEPHYLVMTQSLLLDHDLKVANNYERGDYSAYYGGPLGPQPAPAGVNGEQLSNHAPGLPALIAPAFAAGGYWAVVVWIAVLTGIGTALVWKGGYLLTNDAWAAWFAWASVALTVPVVLHGSLVYPDPIGGVILAGGALALVVVNERRQAETTVGERQAPPWPAWGSLGLGAAIALLPWLHTRMALPAGILAALLALHIGTDRSFATGRRRHLLMFSAPVVLFVAGWLAFFQVTYGTFSPVAAYGDHIPLNPGQIAAGALGLLADQSFGLIPHAPVHLLWLVGLWATFRKNPRLGCELLLLVVPYAMASSAYGMWWAGNSSPARFLVPIVFPLGMTVAAAWARQSGRGRAMSLTLLGASVMIATTLAFGDRGRLPYNDTMGRARWLDWAAPLVDLPRGFPSFFREAATIGGSHALIPPELAWPAVFWAGSILAGCIVFVALDKWLRATIPIRALTAPACLILVCALGTTMTWNNTSGSRVTATRAQLEMLRNQNPRRLPFGVQFVPTRALRAAEIPARLAIATSPFDTPPPSTLLYLEEVPSGTYRIQVTRRPLAGGQLALGIGKASVPTERWSLAADQHPFYLPVHTSMIAVTGDADAIRSVSKVALVPVPDTSAPLLSDARARDAVRYGPMVVFTLDDLVWLEPKGFWVMGERQPEVVVTIDQPVDSFDLDIRNGPGANRVRVWSGAWSTERELTQDELWRVRVPVPDRARALAIGFDVQRSFVPARMDPTSVDHRSLGCWVEVR